MTTGEKLKELRIEKGLSQQRVVDLLPNDSKISKNTLYNAENDNTKKKGSNDATLTILAKFYGVSIEYLRNDNCINRNFETMEIGNYTHLSDKSLERIKRICEYERYYGDKDDFKVVDIMQRNVDMLNDFLENLNIAYIIENIKPLKRLYNIKRNLCVIHDFRTKILDLIYDNKNDLIKNEINDIQKEFTELKEKIDNATDMSSMSKFHYSYENYPKIMEKFIGFKNSYYNNDDVYSLYIWLAEFDEVSIAMIKDVELEINQLRYNVNQALNYYLNSMSFGLPEYNYL